jgi:transposase-like protein
MIEIEGQDFFSATEVANLIGVSRQTLWRWRRSGKVPLGRRFRGREVVFSANELATVEEYANRIEELSESSDQLSLFSGGVQQY